MNKRVIKIVSMLISIIITFTITVPINVYSGTVQTIVGIENDVPGTIVDNAAGIGSGAAGDTLIEIGKEGLEKTPGGYLHGASYVGGGILKWGGYYIGAYDTTQDTVKIFTETSKHATTTGVVIDKTLAVVGAGMGWASIIGGAIAIFTVTATAPATGTLAVVTGTTWAIGSAGVGLTRAIINSETVRNLEDLASGKKKLVFAPFERPDIKEGRDIIKEELGFDPYDRSDNEIPDPNTGIPVYKPNIYIYSVKDLTVNVKLTEEEKITESIPIYTSQKGWNAKVTNGTINGNNDYLFYEALVADKGFQKETGWVINKSNSIIALKNEMDIILDKYKFNEKEKRDFLEFWCNKLDVNTTYAMYPQDTDVINKIMPIQVSPTPKNLFRLWFYFTPVKNVKIVNMPTGIESIQRSDYEVVEWGGLIN